jgi:chemotaxis methyl-accepting protein methylase
MENIIRFMQDRYTLNVSVYDESFLERTIASRMIFSSCCSTKDYLNLMVKNPSEVTSLIDSLTNSYSEFFRNSLTFAILKQIIYPKIFDKKKSLHVPEVRIWSAGCAAGQESYSLAMLADDFITEHQLTTSFRIFATDISSKQLNEARKGIYDQKNIQNTIQGYINTYFTVKGQTYTISESLKNYIDFSLYDLLDKDTNAPPSSIFGGFDIIMCSNVLFYYKPDVQKLILNKLFRSLNAGGFLLTGEAEIAIVRADRNFRQFASPSTIFVRN